MQQVTLTKVFSSDKNKDGQEFKTKDGKKFWKMAIKTQELGDEWLSCLFFDEGRMPQWSEGDQVAVEIEESNGYKNFRIPTKYDTLMAMFNELDQRLRKLENPSTIGNTNVPYPDGPVDKFTEEEIKEDIPF